MQRALPRELRDTIYEKYFEDYDLDRAFKSIWHKHGDLGELESFSAANPTSPVTHDPWKSAPLRKETEKAEKKAFHDPTHILKPRVCGSRHGARSAGNALAYQYLHLR
jgi:hypothetical protein